MIEKKIMSMQELLKSGRIYWIKSPQSLKKWVERDIQRRNILQTIVVKNNGRGNRYYFTSENVEKYLEAFHGGNLDYDFNQKKDPSKNNRRIKDSSK